MLSVSPPLHQDFRARHVLCSPGDGWRSFVPPPLPVVQPAFHFLSSLLDQPLTVTSTVTVKQHTPLDSRLIGSLERMMNLPMEVLDLIASHVVESQTGPNLALASRCWNKLATRHLYQTIQLPTSTSVPLLVRTLQQKPELGQHLQQLYITCQRPCWQQMEQLVVALGENAKRVQGLRVQFAASDLQTGMPFLSSFSPDTFEWLTSPCWLMRPPHLFHQFLSEWPRLRHLSFGNFRFDHVVVQSVAQIKTLETLTLKGNGCSHLNQETLTSLLRLNELALCSNLDANDSRSAFTLQVIDCPLSSRQILHNEILASLSHTEHAHASLSRLLWS